MAYYDKNSQRAHEVAAQYGGKVYDSYFDPGKFPFPLSLPGNRAGGNSGIYPFLKTGGKRWK